MDKISQQLLSLLKVNARTPTSVLARRLGVSRSTVVGRIRSLEEARVIAGYTIQYGGEYRERLVSAHVLIKVAQKLTGRVNLRLRSIESISALYAISGDYDLIAMVSARTTSELSGTLDEIANLDGVERTNSSVILETKFER